jgi:epoxide hydrolase-like predicted phosphatase
MHVVRDPATTDAKAADRAAATSNRPAAPLRGLAVDWGGVLTSRVDRALVAAADVAGIDDQAVARLIRDWAAPVADRVGPSPLHALERGELDARRFEVRVAEELTRWSGSPVAADGLLARVWEHLEAEPAMAALVRRVRRAGIRTALLSNSWGGDYPRDGWDELFDVVVISDEVGMRKPEARIYALTLDLMGLGPGDCVFVDDIEENVAAAVASGFVGIHHSSYAQAAAEIDALFGPVSPQPGEYG